MRRVAPTDGAVLRDIRLRALRTDPQSFGSTYERELAYTDADWDSWAAGDADGEDEATFFALEDDHAVGIIFGARRTEQPNVFDVFGIWVAPESRRQGVARALLETLESWMLDCGSQISTLSVTTAADSARRLYESLGYEPAGWSQKSRHTPGLVEVGYRKALRADL